ncbi:MAG: AraC family transcriptional regulator [Hyphomicrobiaceae bacterium]|nr:AraC family transcriptional regulator [Hyphomicrobiaceae bacterium]
MEDHELQLDSTGNAIARSLLEAHIDDDSDALRAEQSFLAILSWAYGKHTLPDDNKEWRSSLHPKATNRARQAAEILRQRLDNPPTISEVSALVGMNESDLKRCFKCLYGTTIASYSRRRRLEAARDLLAHSSLGIARIALEVGFSSPSQFARAFRLHFGRNPAEYRRLPPQMI